MAVLWMACLNSLSTSVYAFQVEKCKDLQAIRAIPQAEAPGTEVDFEATVTFVCGMREFLFVQDGQDAIFLYHPRVGHVEAGQRVRVKGRLVKGDLLPLVSDPVVSVIEDGILPTPEKVEVIGVEHDCRYLKFEFDVLQTSVGLTKTQFYAKTKSNIDVCIQVRHPDGFNVANVSNIAGHRMQCRGVLGLQIDGGAYIKPGMPQNRIVGYKIFCNSPDDLEIISSNATNDAEQAQAIDLVALKNDTCPEGRFLTFGQICMVDHSEPRGFVVRDGSTFMRFQLHSTQDLLPGMMMRIGGIKSRNETGQTQFEVDYLCCLTHSAFLQPKPITVTEAVDRFSPDERIAVKGRPVRIEQRDGQPNLILAEGNSTIAVEFQDDAIDAVGALDPSIALTVQVTGVSEIDELYDFKLVVVRTSDAILTESKTSVSRVVVISVGVLSMICALAALWIKLLRNQVAQKQRFEAIFDNAGCPIIVFNGELKLIDANQLTADMTGYSKDELRNMSVSQIDKHLPPNEIRRNLVQTMNSQEVAVFPTTLTTKSNEFLNIEVHCRNLTVSQDPEQATYIAIFPDITARSKYENQLKKARDEAIEANNAKSRFLASMSHELRTPLNGVIGMTQLLECTDLTSNQADYLAACRTSGETLLTVIGDVLDFSKMEAGKLELDPQQTELIPFVENIVRASSLQQRTRHIDLASFVDPRLERAVMVDSDRFRQVIFNLIGNAAKFTSKGSIALTAKCSEVNSQYADVQFVVADTGIGIPQDRISNLFEAFEQCDSSTTREYGGTGLGLAICKQIVELMDGKICVESVEGQGSKFIVEVRLQFAPSNNEDQPHPFAIENVSTWPRVAVVGLSKPMSNLIQEMFSVYQVEASFFSKDEMLPHGEFEVILVNSDGEPEAISKLLEVHADLLSDENAPIVIPLVPANYVIEQQLWEDLGVEKPLYKPFSQTRLLQALLPQREALEQTAIDRWTVSNTSRQGLRVLVCEDVPVNQMFANQICQNAGIECVVCDNGKAGIEVLQYDSKFDVIFMDCHMPVMDGYEATRKIRELIKSDLLPNIPIVALTANAVAGDRDKCLAAGMDDYLAKPFEIEQFLEKIQTHAANPSESELIICGELQSKIPIFDVDKLIEQLDSREFVMEIANKFADAFPKHQTDLQTCFEQSDLDETLLIAHRLKGSAAMVKAERISALAEEIESTARDGKLEQLGIQIAEMLEEFENFTNVVYHESL